MLRIGVTGGIGSGKTTACRVFSALGVPVYNSDIRAKELMVTDPTLIAAIKSAFGQNTYRDDILDTKYLAAKVFTNRDQLATLNSIVHPSVMRDFSKWAEDNRRLEIPYVIQENAILFEGGFDRGMDYSVAISAPIEERIERAASRDGFTPEQIRERIENQMDDQRREGLADFVLHNSEHDLLVPQVLRLHEIFNSSINDQ